jgi:hypothetical protein
MIHLITYGNDVFAQSKIRIYNEAKATQWFDTITVYSPEDLDNNFKIKFKDILLEQRGGGYWIWKPYIIKKHLDKINDNDILIYIDAGCSINIHGKQRFDEYINMLNERTEGYISFGLEHIEKVYTVKEIFRYFNIEEDGEIANTGQILATAHIMKKNPNTIKIVDLSLKVLYKDPLLFTNYYNQFQDAYFIENRHDQSISSIIRKMHNTILLKNETYFDNAHGNFGSEESLKYPFWATRKR